MQKYKLTALIFLGFILAACTGQPNVSSKPAETNRNASVTKPESKTGQVRRESFGKTAEGKESSVFILTNAKGAEARITDYGATVTALKIPDRTGAMADIVLGFDSVAGYTSEAYLKANPYFGAIVGRYGNRIGKAKFSLKGREYKLMANNGDNSLHGGKKGFDKVFWTGRETPLENAGSAVEFVYISVDREEGFPGNLTAKVVYTLTDNNELKIDYTATTDKETVINLTHHSYFNLSGQSGGDVLKQKLKILADKFTPIDKGSIPIGGLKPVEGTPFDFREAKEIGKDIDSNNEQLKNGKGYDHNFILNGTAGQMRLAAIVTDDASGRVMEVSTTEPGIQFYTGNFLDGSLSGKEGSVYNLRGGFCLETQHYPDSPNRPDFPSVVLKPGETYKTSTVYKFSIVK